MKLNIGVIWGSLILCQLNCTKNHNPLVPDVNGFIYPIRIGNTWEYLRAFSTFNYRIDSADSVQYSGTAGVDSVKMEVVRKETIFGSIQAFVFRETVVHGGFFDDGEIYYKNLLDGLYLYAYRASNLLALKSAYQRRILFKGRYFKGVREIRSFLEGALPHNSAISDSLIYESPPLQSLKYPLIVGSQWTYRKTDQHWRIDKRIVGMESVDVPAGNFECYKIQWLLDIDNDSEWDEDIIFYDYISSKGLVFRSLLVKDLQFIAGPSPEPRGLFDVKDESSLTRLNF